MGKMKAVLLNEFGSVENLKLAEVSLPSLQDGEVLVRVKAISINPVDVKTRSGKGLATKLKAELPVILGWDIAGEVTEVGRDVVTFKPGDEVFGMVNFPGHGKAYAEYVAASVSHLALKPDHLSFEEAAAGTLAALTAWQVLFMHANVKEGDRVLIHAASGGVGHFAVQLAKYAGAYVVGTSSAKTRAFVLSLGADRHIDYRSELLDAAGNHYDFVLDAIGGDNIDRSLEVMKPGSTIISLPTGLNESVQEKAMALGITGKTMLVRSSGADMFKLAGLFKAGVLKSVVSKTYSFEQVKDAHFQIESGRTVGKIVVTVP
jgi:NADPH:quinone reductase-like Zn-dependent oxidoreductase